MSTKTNFAEIWRVLDKFWLKSLYLMNQSEKSDNDVINDIYLINLKLFD